MFDQKGCVILATFQSEIETAYCTNKLLTEGKVSDPDEVGGERELPEAVGGREQVPPRDDDGPAPMEARVLAANTHRCLPRVCAGTEIEGI